MKFHNALTIKISGIARFYEPINRTNSIVNNNMVYSESDVDVVVVGQRRIRLYRRGHFVCTGELFWIELKSYCYGYCYFDDCATSHLRRWTHWLLVDSANSFCGFVSSVLSAFSSSFKEKAEEAQREKRDLLIDLLGVSDGDKCHAIDHHAYKFQKSIGFFSSPFGLEKWTFPWTAASTVCTAFYWWAKRASLLFTFFFSSVHSSNSIQSFDWITLSFNRETSGITTLRW